MSMALNQIAAGQPEAEGGNNHGSKEAPLVEWNPTPSGVRLVNPYRTNKVDAADLVSLAHEIQNADCFVRANVSSKLQVIAEQVRFLQEQARAVLREASQNSNLHHVPCNFIKKPGNVYYLYQRASGQRCFSMISQKEWGSSCPHAFEGAFRLEADQSWTAEERFEQRENDQQLIDKILDTSNTLAITMGH